jgi:hypothetical protein
MSRSSTDATVSAVVHASGLCSHGALTANMVRATQCANSAMRLSWSSSAMKLQMSDAPVEAGLPIEHGDPPVPWRRRYLRCLRHEQRVKQRPDEHRGKKSPGGRKSGRRPREQPRASRHPAACRRPRVRYAVRSRVNTSERTFEPFPSLSIISSLVAAPSKWAAPSVTGVPFVCSAPNSFSSSRRTKPRSTPTGQGRDHAFRMRDLACMFGRFLELVRRHVKLGLGFGRHYVTRCTAKGTASACLPGARGARERRQQSLPPGRGDGSGASA